MWFMVVCADEAEPGFVEDHGLAILIAIDQEPPYLLFDTGVAAETLTANLIASGFTLDSVAAIALSHGHYDHTGGLAAFQNSPEPPFIYSSPHIDQTRYHVVGNIARSIGIPQSVNLQNFPTSSVVKTRQIWPGIHALTPIPRQTDFETSWDPLCLDKDGVKPDPFNDEIALVVELKSGIVVFSGCGHRGIVNTVMAAIAEFGEQENIVVVGGLHLRNAPKDVVEKTASALLDLGVTSLFAGHCTGNKHYPIFTRYWGDNFKPLKAGMGFSIQ